MGKVLDRVPLFDNFWYEDKEGNVLDVDPSTRSVKYNEASYQVSNFLEVRSHVYSVNDAKKDNFLVRFLKWLLKKVPSSWHAVPIKVSTSFSINNKAWPIIKYLVDKRNWQISDSCILCNSCCERCLDILYCEALNQTPNQNYLKETDTWCYYCKYVDLKHHNRKFIKDIYAEYFFYNDKNIMYKLKEYKKEPPKK